MDMGEFLALRGTSLARVAAEVDATFGLGPDDLLLAVGSVPENLGNAKSDLDLYLISPKGDRPTEAGDEVALVVDRCLVDVRLLPSADLDGLLLRLAGWAELPWDVSRPVKFTIDERLVLHRLRHGCPIHDGEVNAVRSRLPSLDDLARLKLHVARHLSRTVQVDMAGCRDAGDFRSLVFAGQELLGHAVDALVAGYGLTNPTPKWRNRLLDLVPAAWDRHLTVRPSGSTIGEHVWRLHRAPEYPDEAGSMRHAGRITTFARAVFAWAERQALHGPGPAVAVNGWRLLHEVRYDGPLPLLDFDVDFALGDGRVTVGRLNDFGHVLQMSDDDLAYVLLLDGEATAAGRPALAGAPPGGDGGRSSDLDRVISEVSQAGFCLAYPPE